MAFNSARGGSHVSEFLRELQENPAVEPSAEMFALNDSDLSMFTNTEFFDVETGQHQDYQPQPRKPDSEATRSSTVDHTGSTGSIIEDFGDIGFIGGEYGFSGYEQTYASPTISNFPEGLGHLQPIQPGPQGVYPVPPHAHQNGHYPPGPRIGEKRKADTIIAAPQDVPMDEKARLAAEEDKRRRNTAASARFRVKKKEREKALEKSAKDMLEKVAVLETRVSQLETENKWLKSMVLEKNGGNEEFLAKLLDEFGSRQGSDVKHEEASILKAPSSPEARDAGDSSG